MRRLYARAIALVCGAVFVLWTCVGQAQQQETPVQKAEDKIDNALRDLKKGVQGAGETVREQFAKVRTAVHNMGIQSRVYGRLHWDKALTAASIEVEMHQTGVVTLKGVVADEAARTKALALARDTVGVSQVIDLLATTPPATSIDVKAASTPKSR